MLVVDNGSSDASPAVALRHGATLLHESRVGIAAAASTGYDAARGDLILRLDADSVPPPEWTARVASRFRSDAGLDAVTGPGDFVAVPRAVRGPLTGWYWRIYFQDLRRRVGSVPLFGSDLAMRAAAWNAVRDAVHRDDPMVHDDLDLSIHLVQAGMRLELDRDLRVAVSARPLLHPFGMIRRVQRTTHTFALHPDPRRSPNGGRAAGAADQPVTDAG